MKTVFTKLYSFSELSDSAKMRVITREAEYVYSESECPGLSDSVDSLKAIVSAMGLSLSNWSIGPENRNNYATVNIPWQRETELEGGNRTIVSFLYCLMRNGYSRPRCFREMAFPGICGFTGMCYDESICESIWEALLMGESFSSAVNGAADTIAHHCEKELEWLSSHDCIFESLDQSEEIYTEDGDIF